MLYEFTTPTGPVLIRLDLIALVTRTVARVDIVLVGREEPVSIAYGTPVGAQKAYKALQDAMSTWAEATS